MDFGQEGLVQTMNALKTAGIQWVGGGEDLAAASRPAFIQVNSSRLAFLARSIVIVSSASYAGPNEPGVAFLDVSETKIRISECKKAAEMLSRMRMLLESGTRALDVSVGGLVLKNQPYVASSG